MKIPQTRTLCAMFCSLLAASFMISISARAQARDFSKVEIKTTKVTDNFYTLQGQGGTIGVLTGPNGILMVDTEFAPLTGKIVAAIKEFSAEPIRFVINTHVHGDHTGGNENFAKLGATIFARPELRERLMHPSPGANGVAPKPAPEDALPVVTYTSPITFHMDGEEAEAIPIPHAHTDGDTIIHFRNADVIMTGDFFRSIGYPNIDRTNGGSLKGMIDGLATVVALAGPATKIIPGHGPAVEKSAVAAQRDMILEIRDRIAKLIAEGKTLDEVLAAHVTADYDAKVPPANASGDRMADRFVSQVYAELKSAN